MRRRVKLAPVMRNRRGATMVMVAMMMVVMIGFVGVSIDFARMYAFKAQLQTVADASAMAAVIELARQRPTMATSLATSWGLKNKVEGGNAATVDAADVLPGAWDFGAGTFTQVGSWTSPTVNAVKVTARYNAAYTFGKVFGIQTQALSAVGTAALGSAAGSNCMKPWAIPYDNLLWTLGHTPVPDPNYSMTPDDVAYLRDNKKVITFKTSPSDPNLSGSGTATYDGVLIPGNFYAVTFPQERTADGVVQPNGAPVPGANTYKGWISGPCLPYSIGVGDWLLTQTGNMNGPTGQGTSDLCNPGLGGGNGGGNGGNGGNGGGGGGAGGAETFKACKALPSVEMPIYANTEDKGGGKLEVQVKYIGAFVVTEYGNKGSVRGYLTSISGGGGGFTAKPGPVVKGALVD